MFLLFFSLIKAQKQQSQYKGHQPCSSSNRHKNKRVNHSWPKPIIHSPEFVLVFFSHIQYFSKHSSQHDQIKQTIQIAVIVDSRISHLIIRSKHTAKSLKRKKSEDDSVHDSLIQIFLLLFRKIRKVKTSKHNKIAKRPYVITSG